jgi:membrane protease YdiL (CAAX protease family)
MHCSLPPPRHFYLIAKILNLPRARLAPVEDLAVDKFSQFLHIVPAILFLTLLAGDDQNSIFLQWGKWKPAFLIGLVVFLIFGAIAIFTSILPSGLLASLPAAISWLFIFICSKAIMEELWFRGIFLRKYEELIGRQTATISVRSGRHRANTELGLTVPVSDLKSIK